MTWMLPASVGAVVMFAVVWFVGTAIGWRARAKTTRDQYDSLLNQAMQLQIDKTRAEQELEYLKHSINTLLQRPIQAIFNDQQFAAMMSMLDARIKFEQEDGTAVEKKKVN